jgi:Ca2+-binding EF-hand superfamily protein
LQLASDDRAGGEREKIGNMFAVFDVDTHPSIKFAFLRGTLIYCRYFTPSKFTTEKPRE